MEMGEPLNSLIEKWGASSLSEGVKPRNLGQLSKDLRTFEELIGGNAENVPYFPRRGAKEVFSKLGKYLTLDRVVPGEKDLSLSPRELAQEVKDSLQTEAIPGGIRLIYEYSVSNGIRLRNRDGVFEYNPRAFNPVILFCLDFIYREGSTDRLPDRLGFLFSFSLKGEVERIPHLPDLHIMQAFFYGYRDRISPEGDYGAAGELIYAGGLFHTRGKFHEARFYLRNYPWKGGKAPRAPFPLGPPMDGKKELLAREGGPASPVDDTVRAELEKELLGASITATGWVNYDGHGDYSFEFKGTTRGREEIELELVNDHDDFYVNLDPETVTPDDPDSETTVEIDEDLGEITGLEDNHLELEGAQFPLSSVTIGKGSRARVFGWSSREEAWKRF